MKRIIILLVFLICLTACDKIIKDEEKVQVIGLTDENKYIYDYLVNNIVDTVNLKNDRFYLFSKDGKYLYNYTSEIIFKESSNIVMVRGTWQLDGKNLILNSEDRVYLVPDEEKKDFVLEYKESKTKDTFNDLKILKQGDNEYLSGSRSFYKKEIANEEYVKEIKAYLEKGIKKIDLEKLRELEKKD